MMDLSTKTARALIAILLLAATAGWSCAGVAEGGAEGGDLRVSLGSVAPTVLLSGELAAEDSVVLVAPNVNIWPVTMRWIAEEGQEVAAGGTVVEFDNSQLSSNLEVLESQVIQAGNELRRARSQAASSRAEAFFGFEEATGAREKARLAAELPRELTSEQEWARRQLDLEKAERAKSKAEQALAATEESSKAAVDIARLALDKAVLAMERAEEGLAAMVLTAPSDGIVVVYDNAQEDRPFRAGDGTWPGVPVAGLPNLQTLYVAASLFDVDDGRIEAGDQVVAALDAFPEEVLQGTVRSVAGFAQQEGRRSSRRSFRVMVDLDGIDPARMRPGMSVKLQVLRPERQGLLAPRTAIGFADDSDYLQLADGERAAVEVLECDARHCLVQGERLAEGLELAPAAATWGTS